MKTLEKSCKKSPQRITVFKKLEQRAKLVLSGSKEGGGKGRGAGSWGGKMAQTVWTHMNK
jgi:hypothetical protein